MRSAALRQVGTATGRHSSSGRRPGAATRLGCARGWSRTRPGTWACGRCRTRWRDAAPRASGPHSRGRRRPGGACRAPRSPCRRWSAVSVASRRGPARCEPPASAPARGIAGWRPSARPTRRRPSGKAAQREDAAGCCHAGSAAWPASPGRPLQRRAPRRRRVRRRLRARAARIRRGPRWSASSGVRRAWDWLWFKPCAIGRLSRTGDFRRRKVAEPVRTVECKLATRDPGRKSCRAPQVTERIT